MDFRIVWTDQALRELEELVRFIVQDNTSAAAQEGDGIVDHVGILAAFPEIGPI